MELLTSDDNCLAQTLLSLFMCSFVKKQGLIIQSSPRLGDGPGVWWLLRHRGSKKFRFTLDTMGWFWKSAGLIDGRLHRSPAGADLLSSSSVFGIKLRVRPRLCDLVWWSSQSPTEGSDRSISCCCFSFLFQPWDTLAFNRPSISTSNLAQQDRYRIHTTACRESDTSTNILYHLKVVASAPLYKMCSEVSSGLWA